MLPGLQKKQGVDCFKQLSTRREAGRRSPNYRV
jgi:hypothetical protein